MMVGMRKTTARFLLPHQSDQRSRIVVDGWVEDRIRLMVEHPKSHRGGLNSSAARSTPKQTISKRRVGGPCAVLVAFPAAVLVLVEGVLLAILVVHAVLEALVVSL